MKASEILEKMRDEEKQNYFRVLELHETGKASRERLFDAQGTYIGMEKAYHAMVTFELSQKIQKSIEMNEKRVSQ